MKQMITFDTQNIHQELQSLAPNLAALDKKPSGAVPDDYFESLEENVMAQIIVATSIPTQQEELPQDYFETFEDKMMAQLLPKETKPSPIIAMPTKTTWSIYVGLVAASILLVFGWFVFKNPNTDPTADKAWAAIDESEYIDYIESNVEDIDLHLLVEHDIVGDNDLNLITIEQVLEDDGDDILFESEIQF